MRGIVSRAVKVNGTRYDAGAELDLPDDDYAQLLDLGIIKTAPPPSLPKVKVPRSEQERQAALAEAKQRLARSGVTPPTPEP
jgi:hypothetical protein